MIVPSTLQQGDTIALVSPAKAIEIEFIQNATRFFEKQGFKVMVGEHAAGMDRYFSGSVTQRAMDLQLAIDHPEVKAIVCNRGGYGSVELFDRVNWANLLREPRWILGFSDVTYFHCLGQKLGIQTAHTTMPLNFQENTTEAMDSMLNVLQGKTNEYSWINSASNKLGEANGRVIGGNLSILYALLGTTYCPNFENAILFIEDIGEQYYHLDRIFWSFQYAGVWNKIAGLMVGGMTDMKDTATPTQWTIEELIIKHTQYRKIPIAFNAPVGHISDNRAFVIGKEGTLLVSENKVLFSQ